MTPLLLQMLKLSRYVLNAFPSDTKIKENIKLPWKNKSKDGSYQKYIGQLTNDEQEQLFSKYEADFTMFGYSVMNETL